MAYINSKSNKRTSNNISSTTTPKTGRLKNQTQPSFGLTTNPGGFLGTKGGAYTILDNAKQAAIKKAAEKSKKEGSYKAVSSLTTGSGNQYTKASSLPNTQATTDVLTIPDSTYRWNLPPHAWSIPVDPARVNDVVTSRSDESSLHSSRRGMIFLGRKNVGATTAIDSKTGKPKKSTNKEFDKYNYGFQFMWNPESFNQSTSVNMGITPNQNDATAGLTGYVAANSTLNLELRLDRTNDFSCFKYYYNTTDATLPIIDKAQFYKKGQPVNSLEDFSLNMESKIDDLMKRGTEADLDYLYKTINGAGWKQFGVKTSNLSYLMPTIVRIDLGPYKMVGMVSSINVTHLAFTKEMIPIRSNVMLSIDLRANTQFATSNTTGNNVPKAK